MGNQPGKLHYQNQNQSGRPKKNVHWKSAERPSPPGRPILIPLSDQQPDVVNLRWERPKLDGGSPITGYVVEHRRMGSPHWVRATPKPVSRCEVSISGLEPGWRYQFRAFAENVVGRSDASELSDALTVTLQRNAISVPRFIDELLDMHAVEDERIEFRVRVLGQPPPEINWFKDGYEIFSSRRTKIVNDNDVSVLIIHQVALTDEGEIKCTATNRAGHVVTKARLLVQAPPRIRLPRTYEDGLIVEADEVLRLKVGIAGQPPPVITWLHEGEPVSSSGRFEIVNTDRNSLLKIDNVQRDDRGEYSIRASNKLGDDVTSFLVTVTARPNPPGKVRLNMSFGKSATLSWTAPVDDGGCKIGNYIVEYFRVGWNVWLKAVTTRSLSTTLNDLIEGSEYKFRVKAENPYGLSDPSEESEVLFLPDPKRGITKPKSETNMAEEKKKPLPPRRKTLSPLRPQQDAATETPARLSPSVARKPKPQLLDNEDLHREMSYGTSDKVLRMDVRKSPSLSSADSTISGAKPKVVLKIEPLPLPPALPIPAAPKSPQRLPYAERGTRTQQFLQHATNASQLRTASPSPSPSPSPLRQLPSIATPERSATPEVRRKRSLSPLQMGTKTETETGPLAPVRRSPPPGTFNKTPALLRSAEPVQLGVNQQVRRYSGHSLSPAKNVPALAIAIATSLEAPANGKDVLPAALFNFTAPFVMRQPKIQISAPPPLPPFQPIQSTQSILHATRTPETTPLSTPPPSAAPLSIADKHDDVHTSNEFMLVVFDKNSKVKDKNKPDSFELDLEDALQPPPISISAPDLASLAFTNLHTFPLRRSVSSTELLYERAMARFYEAVELEEAEKARKLRVSQDKMAVGVTATTVRKRLGSMTETERLSFERRSEMRRQSADLAFDLKVAPKKWSSRENVSNLKPFARSAGMLMHKHQESQESDELSDYLGGGDGGGGRAPQKTDSYDMCSDYTESTASSDENSIKKFKMELMARTRSPSPRELETYHPRNMSAGVFTPYRAPTPEQAVVVLNRPMPLPSPDFVPKPILKRSSNENMQPPSEQGAAKNGANGTTTSIIASGNPSGSNDMLDIAKGIKSFFKRDKRSATEKNTEENQIISNPKEKANAATIAAEVEAKRRAKEEEERKRLEAERLMQEEAHAAVDHYSDLVRQVSTTHKYHTPLYLDRDELKKAAEKAAREGIFDLDVEEADEEVFASADMRDQLQTRHLHSSEVSLMPPAISSKPRLSISERGQMIHVRDTGSNLAMIETKVKPPQPPDTPSEDSEQTVPDTEAGGSTTTQVMSKSTVEHADGRGRTRIVKVKRIIKKRVPSGTRSRDPSTSRPPSSLATMQDISAPPPESAAPEQRRVVSRTRIFGAESRSPGPLGRALLPATPFTAPEKKNVTLTVPTCEVDEVHKSAEQLSEEAHEKVRSALSYSTDLVLFVVACYVYLFKDARLVLPILALMIYRQMGEVLNNYIPNWMRRKKD